MAIPIGTFGAVENVGGVVGANVPPAPIVKAATLVEPELATYRNGPARLMVIPTGADAAPVENVAGVVGVSAPPAPMLNAATSFMPLFVTYKNDPFGEMAIL